MHSSCMRSPAAGPMMCAPKIRSLFLSAKIFTKPSAAKFAFALPFPININFPILIERSLSFACCSVKPTDATSGAV